MSQQSSTNPGSSPWYCLGLRFTCVRCGNCCTGKPGYVWVNDREIDIIAKHLGLTRNEFRAKYLIFAPGGYSIVEKSNYDCAMLKDRACSVYTVRPRQCRTWPFWKENLGSPTAWDEGSSNCPGIGQGKLYNLSEIEAILRGERDT